MSKQNMCSGHKNETKTTTQQKSKQNFCQNRDKNSGPFASQSDALPLDHGDK